MTKITVSMQDFLRTGEFGPVHLGMSRGQLRGLLGEPENWGPSPAKHNAVIWKYGDIEFYLNEDLLWYISANNGTTLKGGRSIDLDPWVLNGDATVGQALRDLEDAYISCQRIDWKVDDTTERFMVGAGIELRFWDANQYGPNYDDLPTLAPADMTFSGFSYSAREDSMPEP